MGCDAFAGAGLINFPLPAKAKSPEKKSISIIKEDVLTGKKDLGEEAIREELSEKAYKLGFEYLSEGAYPGCALCVIAAIQDTLDFKDVKISPFYTANTV